MKRKTLILIGILLVILISLICIIVFGPKTNKGKNLDVLSISSRSEIENYIEQNNIETYSFDEESACISNIDLFDFKADVNFIIFNDNVDEINIGFLLFQYTSGTEYENDTDVPEEVPVYQFTDKDKNEISKTFNSIKKHFESYLGCTFEDYDVVPTINFEDIENNEDNFFDGKFVKEYSVRDGNGVLWIMRYEASYGSASVEIYKIINETGFEGFIPAIDMTKE